MRNIGAGQVDAAPFGFDAARTQHAPEKHLYIRTRAPVRAISRSTNYTTRKSRPRNYELR